MNNFKKNLLDTKKVSVWGIGYLGYTTVLRLQSKGFSVSLYDFIPERLEGLETGEYPSIFQRNSWTKRGEIPKLDLQRVEIVKNIDKMFDSNIHIIAVPYEMDSNKNFESIKNTILKNKQLLENSIVIFQSAAVPGFIENFFKEIVKENKIGVATAFRDDWDLETFFSKDKIRGLSADSLDTLKKIEFFFSLFEIKTFSLNSIKEAEILANAEHAFESTVNGFLNQLAIAYPDTNLRDLSSKLLENFSKENIEFSIGESKFRIANSSNHLIEGSKREDALSLLKESNNSNIALLLFYADLIIRKKFKKVSIFGVSSEGDLKEARLSPTVILSNYLNNNGVEVLINDPFFTDEELGEIIPYGKAFNINDKLECDVCIFMTPHRTYKYFTQKDIDTLGISKVKVLIDNTKILKDFQFSENTIYHLAGDGKLGELE